MEIYTWPVNDYRNYLRHYGIPGMKWGVRRFQNPDGSLTPEGRERYGYGKSREPMVVGAKPSKSKSFLEKRNEKYLEKLNDPDHSKSDYRELAAYLGFLGLDLITLNVPGLIVDTSRLVAGAYGTAKDSRSEKLPKSGKLDKKSGLYLKDREYSKKEDMKAVNPGYLNMNGNTKNNCMLCTTAYDMRRRGYDVKANKASYGYLTDKATDWYIGGKIKQVPVQKKGTLTSVRDAFWNSTLVDATTSELLKQGEGARGNLMVQWTQGGGHSVVYEIENGKVILRDCQSGSTSTPGRMLSACRSAEYMRTDNLKPNMKKIKEAVR